MQQVLGFLSGAVGSVAASFTGLVVVWVVAELIKIWRKDGFLVFASQFGWTCFVGGAAVFIVSMICVGGSWLLDAGHLSRVAGQAAGWSFVVSCFGLPCYLQAEHHLSKGQAAD